MVNKGRGSLIDVRKKLSYDHELIATCYHESGHTICGLLNYLYIYDVGVEVAKDKRNQKDLGYTNFDAPLNNIDILNGDLAYNFIMSEIYINYAGLAAEKLFYKDICGTSKLPMVLKSGSWSDRKAVNKIIEKYNLSPPGKKRYSYKNKLFNATRKSLEQYWDDVKIVSHALFEKRKLYTSDLKTLLIKKSPNKIFWKQRFKDIESIFEAATSNDQKLINSIISRK